MLLKAYTGTSGCTSERLRTALLWVLPCPSPMHIPESVRAAAPARAPGCAACCCATALHGALKDSVLGRRERARARGRAAAAGAAAATGRTYSWPAHAVALRRQHRHPHLQRLSPLSLPVPLQPARPANLRLQPRLARLPCQRQRMWCT